MAKNLISLISAFVDELGEAYNAVQDSENLFSLTGSKGVWVDLLAKFIGETSKETNSAYEIPDAERLLTCEKRVQMNHTAGTFEAIALACKRFVLWAYENGQTWSIIDSIKITILNEGNANISVWIPTENISLDNIDQIVEYVPVGVGGYIFGYPEISYFELGDPDDPDDLLPDSLHGLGDPNNPTVGGGLSFVLGEIK